MTNSGNIFPLRPSLFSITPLAASVITRRNTSYSFLKLPFVFSLPEGAGAPAMVGQALWINSCVAFFGLSPLNG